MNAEKWQKINELFHASLEVEADKRIAFIKEKCDDEEIFAEVSKLISAHEEANSFIQKPVAEDALKALSNENNSTIISRETVLSGRKIGRFEIISTIGKGGMGEVFLARDESLERDVAIKILPKEFTSDSSRVSRFIREAKAASALNHPNILTIHEIGEFDGTHFIASEYVNGQTLTEFLRNEKLTIKKILDIAKQIVSALQIAHEAGIVHRDIKPDNVMIRRDGIVKVLDFGLAKLLENSNNPKSQTQNPKSTIPGLIMGTPNYMSPEQARGKDIDFQTDIFSFGVVLYEMLSGKMPFQGDSVSDIIASVLTKEPEPLADIPPDLEKIVVKCLQKDKRNRYQTAKSLLQDLEEFREELDFQEKLEKTAAPNRPEQKTEILQAKTTIESESANSIAVLSFTNLSPDAENEFFCDGLAEELLNALSNISDLKVAARTSAFSFKGKNVSVSEIGEKLKVKTVLEGSVQKSGEKLRISVQLVNAADGYRIWAERYDREMKDIFEVQDEIALAVVDALKIKLFSSENAAILKRETENSEAYEYYLRGRFFWNKFTEEGFLKAREYFQKAIELDPNFALAHAGYGDSYLAMGVIFAPPKDCYEQAKTAIAKALELDDANAEIWITSAARKYFYEWDWEGCVNDCQKAVSLSSQWSNQYTLYAQCLITQKKFDEAQKQARKVFEIDPLWSHTASTLGFVLYLSGKTEEGLKYLLLSDELEPGNFWANIWIIDLYEQTGKYSDALHNRQKLLRRLGNEKLADEIGVEFEKTDYQGVLRKCLADLENLAKFRYVSPLEFAKLYAHVGENEKALDWLEKAYEERTGYLCFLGVQPTWKSLHSSPRFQTLIKKIGLPSVEVKEDAKTKIINAQTADEIPQTVTAGNSENKSNSLKKYLVVGLAAIVISIVGFFGFQNLFPSKQIESVAVLPFVNESGNADIEYLSDGMTEILIKNLTNIPNLNVKARSSVFRYKGTQTDVKKVAAELNVQAVVTGTIKQVGNDIILSLDLVEAATEKNLWNERYTRKQSELVALQNEIARDVSDNLKLKLTGEQTAKIADNGTTNAEAYQAYLKGRFFSSKGEHEQSLKYFQEAVNLDPNFALGYAGLADAYTLLGTILRSSMSAEEAIPKARIAAEKAIALNPNLSEVYTSLAWLKFRVDWDWAGAERDFKRAIELNPKNAQAHQWYGELLSCLLRHDEAIAEVKKAVELEPFTFIIVWNLGKVYSAAGHYDEAIVELKKSIELDRTMIRAWGFLGVNYMLKGMEAEAFEAFLKGREAVKTPPERIEIFKRVFKEKGMKAVRAKELEFQFDEQRFIVTPLLKMAYYANLEDKEKTLQYLEEGFRTRNGSMVSIQIESSLNFVRDDPRYKEVVRKMNFPQ